MISHHHRSHLCLHCFCLLFVSCDISGHLPVICYCVFVQYDGLSAASSVCAWRLRANRCVHHFLLWERCAFVSCMLVCGWWLCCLAQVAPGIFLHRTCGTCACTCLGGRTCQSIHQHGRCARVNPFTSAGCFLLPHASTGDCQTRGTEGSRVADIPCRRNLGGCATAAGLLALPWFTSVAVRMWESII